MIAIPTHLDIRQNISLGKLTTFRVGGPAEFLALPRDESELQDVILYATEHQLPITLLGGGSNIVVADDGIKGMVIKLAGNFRDIQISADGSEIIVGAACSFPKLTKAAMGLGWQSTLGWYGTPGLVGGALIMNAGAKHGEIGDVVDQIYDQNGKLDGIQFNYRSTNFKPTSILTRSILRCDDADRLDPKDLVTQARSLLSKRHATQPKKKCAGSIFKNPPGDYAGRLIEEAGLKGMQIGDAMASPIHANFIVNTGNARASDIQALARRIRLIIQDKFGVDLKSEVKWLGFENDSMPS